MYKLIHYCNRKASYKKSTFFQGCDFFPLNVLSNDAGFLVLQAKTRRQDHLKFRNFYAFF